MDPLRPRRELQSLRPAGASQKAEGPEGPMAPIVTTGISVVGKKLSHTSSLCWAMLIFLYRSTEDPRIVRVILAPKRCNFRRIEKGAMLI